MKVNILLFATLKDIAGQKHLVLEFPQSMIRLQDIRSKLIMQYPKITKHLEIAIVAVNEEYIFDDCDLQDGDDIAFFPPVSGGETCPIHCDITTDSIDHDKVIQSLTQPQVGAVVIFSGIVRGYTQHDTHTSHQTHYLEYDAYQSMALKKMKQVGLEITQRYPKIQGIAIIQRIGQLHVGQNTIVIACAAAHRHHGCFDAASYGIDRLKEIVPIWKKEVGDHETWIEGGYRPTPQDTPSIS